MERDAYICIYIYIYMHTRVDAKPGLGEQFTIFTPVITVLKLTLGSAAITDVFVFNDSMEQMGLILDKIAFHTWGPI